jgi:hypothetical protein
MRGAPQSGFSLLISPDQDAQLRVDLRSSSQWARLPTPVAAKSGSVPTHERLGPDDCDSLQDRWKPAIQLDEEQAVMVGKLNATTTAALQDNQLMSKHCVLGFKPYLQLEWRRQDGQKEVEQPDHPASLNDSCAASHPDEVFGMHTLVEGGADPRAPNRNGSTPILLATMNTGKSGSGSPGAKEQQREILRILKEHGAT